MDHLSPKMRSMRILAALIVLAAACGSGDDGTTTYAFGPFHIAPSEEIDGTCVPLDPEGQLTQKRGHGRGPRSWHRELALDRKDDRCDEQESAA